MELNLAVLTTTGYMICGWKEQPLPTLRDRGMVKPAVYLNTRGRGVWFKGRVEGKGSFLPV